MESSQREEGELHQDVGTTIGHSKPPHLTERLRKRSRSRWGPDLEQPLFSAPPDTASPRRPSLDQERQVRSWRTESRPAQDHRPTMLSNFRHDHDQTTALRAIPQPLFSVDMLDQKLSSPESATQEPQPPQDYAQDKEEEPAPRAEQELEDLDKSMLQVEQEIQELERQLSTPGSAQPPLLCPVSKYPLHRIDISKSLIHSIYQQAQKILENQIQLASMTINPPISNVLSSKVKIALQKDRIYRSKLKAVYTSEYAAIKHKWRGSETKSEYDGLAYQEEIGQYSRNDPSTRWVNTLAKPEPMIPFKDLFIDQNAHDPSPASALSNDASRFSSYVPTLGLRPFTKTEANIFMEKYLLYPKKWEIIVKALPGRTFCETIQYYYENKKRVEFKKWLRMPGQKKKSASVHGSGYAVSGAAWAPSSSMSSMIKSGQSKGVGSRLVMSETMLDVLYGPEEPKASSSTQIEGPKKVKRAKTKSSSASPIPRELSPIIPSIAVQCRTLKQPLYFGFPWIDWAKTDSVEKPSLSPSIVSWLPLERVFLVDAFIRHGQDWNVIAQEFAAFRKGRGEIPNWKDKPIRDTTLLCMDRALAEFDPSPISQMMVPLDSETGVKFFYDLYRGSYRFDSLRPIKKVRAKTVKTTVDEHVDIVTVNNEPGSGTPTMNIDINEKELDALTGLESLASIAQSMDQS